ncbi:MAG: NAD(P)/FAD-dependent oxidoreductase [Clostridiales bacterium]|nr:FAD-dependent oxidoreductase [Eubacteriales bacterium]MDH7566657.1 NAD(P)/FAD-dependent oxidoreductase [Clostridiales bacterium]
MNVNSMSTGMPVQPDNPTDSERRFLGQYALWLRGRPEDFDFVTNLMLPPPDITSIAAPGSFRGIQVGIVGGGLAGLSAAYELRKLGFDITIFEALEDRIGGRVYTYYFDRERKLYGEFGPMRIPVTHETVWHYINLFKLPTRTFIQVNSNAVIHLRDVSVRNDPEGRNVQRYIYPEFDLNEWEKRTKWQDLVYRGLDRHLLEADPWVRSEILQVRPYYHPEILYWDSRNSRQMLESSRLSQDAINLVSDLTPLPGENLYSSYIDYIQESYSADLSFLYEIPGGLVKLPMAFYKSFMEQSHKDSYPDIPGQLLGKVAWKGGSRVTGISFNSDQEKVGIEYRNSHQRGALYEQFDYVICAIPFSTLRNIAVNPLFSHTKMQAIKEVNYIPAQKTCILFRNRFWEEGRPEEQIIGGGSYTDLPLTSIWYPSDHAAHCSGNIRCIPGSMPYHSLHIPEDKSAGLSKERGVLIASYNFNLDTTRLANLPEGVRLNEIKRELEKVHCLPKGYLDTLVLDFKTVNWNTETWFRGALCFFTPEQKRIFSYAIAQPEYNNRVFFAGEHISAKHRWMQGALKSGMEAANAVALTCRKANSSN